MPLEVVGHPSSPSRGSTVTAGRDGVQVAASGNDAGGGGAGSDLSGLTGWVAEVIEALGAVGVGALVVLETVFPPIPSEIVLPFAGYLSYGGRLNPVVVVVAATAGSVLGALLLYGLAARLGRTRSRALLARLPLVTGEDVERAEQWFARHGRPAVFLGRLVPGVRSFVSLPAGAERMPLVTFTALTAAGSLLWNAALVAAGYALGTQWRTVEDYAGWIDRGVVAAIVLTVGWFVVRRLRRRPDSRARS